VNRTASALGNLFITAKLIQASPVRLASSMGHKPSGSSSASFRPAVSRAVRPRRDTGALVREDHQYGADKAELRISLPSEGISTSGSEEH